MRHQSLHPSAAAATSAALVTGLHLFFDGLLHVLWPERLLGIG